MFTVRSGLKLLPSTRHANAAAACERQEVKQAAEVVCVSPLSTTLSVRSLSMLHPKPERGHKITAVGAEWVKKPSKSTGSWEHSITLVFSLAGSFGNLKSKRIADCCVSRAVQSLPPISFHNLHYSKISNCSSFVQLAYNREQSPHRVLCLM